MPKGRGKEIVRRRISLTDHRSRKRPLKLKFNKTQALFFLIILTLSVISIFEFGLSVGVLVFVLFWILFLLIYHG